MPTYDYVCGKCEHAFEHFQSIKAAPLRKCPACGMPALKRLMGAGGGLIFKGSGFYTTDYRSDSYKKAADGDAKPKSDAKSESKTESAMKPAAGKEAPPAAEPGAKKPAKPKAGE
jgi:putative FmdB family regulatory protein